MSDLRPRVVCLMQPPPPVHGASVLSEIVARSEVLFLFWALLGMMPDRQPEVA